jgi:hypothetical protein
VVFWRSLAFLEPFWLFLGHLGPKYSSFGVWLVLEGFILGSLGGSLAFLPLYGL